MEPVPYLLVFISAFTHSIWNFLVKRGNEKDIFIGLSKISEIIIFFVPFIWFFSRVGFGSSSWLLFVVVAAFLVILNYYFLSQAYKHNDFSIAYPISRSSTLFLPFLGFLFLREKLDIFGLAAVFLVTVAVLMISMNAYSKSEFKYLYKQVTRSGIVFALLAAFSAASYTIWDKIAVTNIHPFIYFYSYTALTALGYTIFIRNRFQINEIKEEWRRNKIPIVIVGILNTFTYSLVLVALSSSNTTHIGTLRQLSLVVGTILGWKLLKESLPLPKIVSVILIIIASGLLAFQR